LEIYDTAKQYITCNDEAKNFDRIKELLEDPCSKEILSNTLIKAHRPLNNYDEATEIGNRQWTQLLKYLAPLYGETGDFRATAKMFMIYDSVKRKTRPGDDPKIVQNGWVFLIDEWRMALCLIQGHIPSVL
jgi:hypothetical protein